ncbi:hypothetical protein [Pseudomonas sp. Gutcm_11s]|uniref:hypothetical protein n=1 Tax=Pseudomonas sp. Gutcm_11s TaxID=3026088 RepID=UPI002362C01E|nr:hypothetical protein [Pseudomonas sp. Gutcm_11s]MDD0841318.1 hypothetical protein [Pseudomonas sp. Gutcm_11s]
MAGRQLCLSFVAALLLGCAGGPPVQVSESTWRQVDQDIASASRSAEDQAREHALQSMQRWLALVQRQTDEEFIPWFSGYWTQQWLSLKVSWYKLGADEDDPTVRRLAAYLQEEYQDQVLEPVAEEISPERILRAATRIYVRQLDMRLQPIPARHGVPQEQFDQRLAALPVLAGEPRANLYQLIHTDPLERLPAYAALLDRVGAAPGGDWSTDPGISLVAQRTSERLVDEMTTSGAASAVSAMLGRVAGAGLSLGVTLFTLITRENDRPEREAQLRSSLDVALDQEFKALLSSPDRGVLAGVWCLSGQVEEGLGRPFRYQP